MASDGGSSVDAGSKARGDAGAPPVHADCKLIRGPARLSLTGPASLPVVEGGVHVVFNRQGVAGVSSPAFPALKAPPSPALPSALVPKSTAAPAPQSPLVPEGTRPTEERASSPPCAAAGRFVFCMDAEGFIHRRVFPSGEGDKVVARGVPNTSIAAAAVDGDHTILTYLGVLKTSEGLVMHAYAVLDDGPPTQLSEEGSGATFVTIAPRDEGALAMYIDARTALTPVHARSIAASGGLRLGKDAVVFVGDGSDRRASGAIASAPLGPSFVLMATAGEGTSFGMAALKIDGDPQDDTRAVWSMYPNGITPAPIAATSGVSPVRVARVRPATAEVGAWRTLELGHLDASGSFAPLCSLLESRSLSDVSIAVDKAGSVWIVYTSADGTWVEQRGGA